MQEILDVSVRETQYQTRTDAESLLGSAAIQWQSTINKGLEEGDLEASAFIYQGGVILRDDIMEDISDYRRKDVPELWNLMPKRETPYLNIKEGKRPNYSNVGYADRESLNVTSAVLPDPDISDPGEEVRAIVKIVDISYMERTMNAQQNRLMGRQYNPDHSDVREEITTAMWQFLAQELISGVNNVGNPLAFNGLLSNLQPAHDRSLDTTEAGSRPIWFDLDRIITEASNSTKVNRNIDTIVCGGAGVLALKRELQNSRLYTEVELTSGVVTSAIWANNKKIPLIVTPWMPDTVGGVGQPDEVSFWCYDKSHFEWYGVTPLGGQPGYAAPQIFDVTQNLGAASLNKPMLKQVIAILLGTPKFNNGGDALYRLKVTVPEGYAFDNDA